MEKNGNSGCRIAALIVGGIVLVFALVVGGLVWMFNARSDQMQEEARIHYDQAVEAAVSLSSGSGSERLEFDESDWESLVPLEEDQPVSLKQFILTIEDPRSTELARETFRERADGAPVTWTMKLGNVKEEGGILVAMLEVPYATSRSTTTTYGNLDARAEFDPSQRDALIKLRQGDPVTIQGRLALDERMVRIVDAMVAEVE